MKLPDRRSWRRRRPVAGRTSNASRVEQLLSQLLSATAELMAAREVTGRLEGELAVLRAQQRPAISVPCCWQR